jgi:hypothetical protein
VSSHVVVDRAKFGHGNPVVRARICERTQNKEEELEG